MKIKFNFLGIDFSFEVGPGTSINKVLRARRGAHEAFDPIWRYGYMTRTEAYRWLSERLGIEHSECHMSLFDVETCERVVELSREYARKKYSLE